MKCAWKSFLKVIPVWMRNEVDKLGADKLLELRLRVGIPPELVLKQNNMLLDRIVELEDIQFCINTASEY